MRMNVDRAVKYWTLNLWLNLTHPLTVYTPRLRSNVKLNVIELFHNRCFIISTYTLEGGRGFVPCWCVTTFAILALLSPNCVQGCTLSAETSILTLVSFAQFHSVVRIPVYLVAVALGNIRSRIAPNITCSVDSLKGINNWCIVDCNKQLAPSPWSRSSLIAGLDCGLDQWTALLDWITGSNQTASKSDDAHWTASKAEE